MTKKFETFVRTDLERLQKADDFVTIKGEFVLVVGGAVTMETEVTEDKILTTDDYVSAVTMLIEDGMAKKEAIREVAKRLGVARRDVYNAVEAVQDV